MLRLLLVITACSLSQILCATQGCKECDEKSCRPPTECLAGMVKDRCGCCYVCGRRENELCDSEDLPLPYRNLNHQACGENLRCQPRTDLAPGDTPIAHCVCERTDTLCGSDGITYENECQLTEARYKLRNGLKAVHRGPCNTAPKIRSPPENVANYTGGNVVMSCEVSGWPIPVIEWRVDTGDGESSSLPSDDSKIAVQSRGGPGKFELTGWLQLLSITYKDQATYWCFAKNELGEASASAKVSILEGKGESNYSDIHSNDL